MSRTKVYVAGAAADWRYAREIMQTLQQSGLFQVTYDWTQSVEKHGRGDPQRTPIETLQEACNQDLEGIRECDIFLLLPDPNLYGAMVELGYALALDKQVFLFGHFEEFRYSVFFEHPNVRLAGSLFDIP